MKKALIFIGGSAAAIVLASVIFEPESSHRAPAPSRSPRRPFRETSGLRLARNF